MNEEDRYKQEMAKSKRRMIVGGSVLAAGYGIPHAIVPSAKLYAKFTVNRMNARAQRDPNYKYEDQIRDTVKSYDRGMKAIDVAIPISRGAKIVGGGTVIYDSYKRAKAQRRYDDYKKSKEEEEYED